jgi:cytochrome c peroxidase
MVASALLRAIRSIKIRSAASRGFCSLAVLALLVLTSCQSDPNTSPNSLNPGYPASDVPSDFPQVIAPANNPFSKAKAELGRYLFYDKRLSFDNTIACASCHLQERAFSDSNQFSRGVLHQMGDRNAPGIVNVAYGDHFMWSGEFLSLEDQASGPIHNPIEMAFDTTNGDGKTVAKLSAEPRYASLFRAAWGDSMVTMQRVLQSIGSFERTFISGYSAYDLYNRGDQTAISASAKRGLGLFMSDTVSCFKCHAGFNFTDNNFHSTGLEFNSTYGGDRGRYLITHDRNDIGKFKTPTLRNVGVTAPYEHDGRFATLEDVVRHYNSGGRHNPTQDSLVHDLHLSDQSILDLAEFLRSLTDDRFLHQPAFQSPW